jgi:hypothetical protein
MGWQPLRPCDHCEELFGYEELDVCRQAGSPDKFYCPVCSGSEEVNQPTKEK